MADTVTGHDLIRGPNDIHIVCARDRYVGWFCKYRVIYARRRRLNAGNRLNDVVRRSFSRVGYRLNSS